MGCKETRPILGCWSKSDGTFENIIIHYTYGKNTAGNEIITAIRYTDVLGNPLSIPATDIASSGQCKDCCPLAYESCYCFDNEKVEVLHSTDPQTLEVLLYKRLDTQEIISISDFTATPIDCCEECCDLSPATCVILRQDYYNLADWVAEAAFPLTWTITGTTACGDVINENVTTNFDASWTDNTNLYDDLIAALDSIEGVTAQVSTILPFYNGDGAPDIRITIAAGTTLTVTRNYTDPTGDFHTISESGGTTTVNTNFSGSPGWKECGTGNDLFNGTFPNNL